MGVAVGSAVGKAVVAAGVGTRTGRDAARGVGLAVGCDAGSGDDLPAIADVGVGGSDGKPGDASRPQEAIDTAASMPNKRNAAAETRRIVVPAPLCARLKCLMQILSWLCPPRAGTWDSGSERSRFREDATPPGTLPTCTYV